LVPVKKKEPGNGLAPYPSNKASSTLSVPVAALELLLLEEADEDEVIELIEEFKEVAVEEEVEELGLLDDDNEEADVEALVAVDVVEGEVVVVTVAK